MKLNIVYPLMKRATDKIINKFFEDVKLRAENEFLYFRKSFEFWCH